MPRKRTGDSHNSKDDADGLLEHLRMYCYGYGRRKPASVIAAHLHISERTVGALAAELVKRKHPICSTCAEGRDSGYYYPAKREETKAPRANIVSRIEALRERLAAFDDGVDRAFGNPSLFDLEEVSR